MSGVSFIGISVGNTRTQVARFVQGEIAHVQPLDNADGPTIVHAILQQHQALEGGGSIVLASVNDAVADPIESALRDQLDADMYRVGDDLPVPIGTQLDPETIPGVDRLLNAAAAFAVLKQACIVVDAGTAITVDFVDGEGTFHGGAIAPGARLQLRSLHEHTALLPDISFQAPRENEPFGRNTAEAMLHGVTQGLRGLVWKLTERYAEAYGAFPTVIATGGDAQALFGDDELIDRIIPDLTLRGIAECVRVSLEQVEHGGDDPESSDDDNASPRRPPSP